MPDGDGIQIELVKLASGERLLRVTEAASGLALERKVNRDTPVHDQKQQLLGVFQAALDRARLATA